MAQVTKDMPRRIAYKVLWYMPKDRGWPDGSRNGMHWLPTFPDGDHWTGCNGPRNWSGSFDREIECDTDRKWCGGLKWKRPLADWPEVFFRHVRSDCCECMDGIWGDDRFAVLLQKCQGRSGGFFQRPVFWQHIADPVKIKICMSGLWQSQDIYVFALVLI